MKKEDYIKLLLAIEEVEEKLSKLKPELRKFVREMKE